MERKDSICSLRISEEMPLGFAPQLEVTGCYMHWEERLLLLRRSETESHPGTWGVPAGGMERGETITLAMLREIKEEIGWGLRESELVYLGPVYAEKPNIQYIFHMFYHNPKNERVVILSDEHTEHRWVNPKDASKMDLIPGGIESLGLFLRRLQNLL